MRSIVFYGTVGLVAPILAGGLLGWYVHPLLALVVLVSPLTMMYAWGLYFRRKWAGLRAELRRKLFPHALRARCATYWAYKIPNVTVLQDVFGWETPQVAQRYIAHSGGQAERAFREWRLQNG